MEDVHSDISDTPSCSNPDCTETAPKFYHNSRHCKACISKRSQEYRCHKCEEDLRQKKAAEAQMKTENAHREIDTLRTVIEQMKISINTNDDIIALSPSIAKRS